MEQVTKPVMVDMATLIKYEIKRTGKGLLATAFLPFISLLAFTGISLIRVDALRIIGLTIGVISAIAIAGATFVYLVFDYWRSGYGATAYLTHSMPVSGGKIFWAKLIWSSLAYLLTLALTFGGALIIAAGVCHNMGIPFETMWNTIFHAPDGIPNLMVAMAIIYLIISVVYGLVFFYFSISIGFESRLQRFGKGGPVLVGIVLYIIAQVIGLASLLLPIGIQTNDDYKILRYTAFNIPDGVSYMPIGMYLVPALMLVALTWRTWRSWQSKISM